MRQFKKILAVVIILALVLGSAPAFAVNTTAAAEVESLQDIWADVLFIVERYLGRPSQPQDNAGIQGARINVYLNGTRIETLQTGGIGSARLSNHTISGHFTAQLVYVPGDFCLHGEDGEKKDLGYFDGVNHFFGGYMWFLNPCDCGTTPPPPPPAFSDVQPGNWFYESVENVVDKGLMQGLPNNRFDPLGTLTRAQVAQILFNAWGNNATSPASFDDIRPEAWYAQAVNWAAAQGLTDVTSGNFRPGDPAPRELVAEMLFRVANWQNITLPQVNTPSNFTDQGDITYNDAVNALQQAGIISGFPDGSFGPQETVNRAQMARMADLFTDVPGLLP